MNFERGTKKKRKEENIPGMRTTAKSTLMTLCLTKIDCKMKKTKNTQIVMSRGLPQNSTLALLSERFSPSEIEEIKKIASAYYKKNILKKNQEFEVRVNLSLMPSAVSFAIIVMEAIQLFHSKPKKLDS